MLTKPAIITPNTTANRDIKNCFMLIEFFRLKWIDEICGIKLTINLLLWNFLPKLPLKGPTMPKENGEHNEVQLRTRISRDLYKLLKQFQKDHELAYESEVVRIALALLLKAQSISYFYNNKNKTK